MKLGTTILLGCAARRTTQHGACFQEDHWEMTREGLASRKEGLRYDIIPGSHRSGCGVLVQQNRRDLDETLHPTQGLTNAQ